MKALALKKLAIDPPVMLAPIAGYTLSAARIMAREMGAGLVFTEMVSAAALHYNNSATRGMLEFGEKERPICCQIWGAVPGHMAEAAKAVADAGFDAIDVNMGCPVRKVVKTGSGVALMSDLPLAAKIIAAVRGATRLPFTVKMRTGPVRGKNVAVELSRIAESEGADAVIVHARSGEDRFSSKADWAAIAAVKDAVAIPVVGNGGIESAADVGRMGAETGCDAVMIGQAALRGPWIFRDAGRLLSGEAPAEAPSRSERADTMERHFSFLSAEVGEGKAVRLMKKAASWYLTGEPGARAMRRLFNSQKSGAEFREYVRMYRSGKVPAK